MEFASLPFHVDNESATRPQSFHLTGAPVVGQGRKEVHGTIVALQQHLADAGGTAEIAVDLEWRVSIEEVGIGPPVGILPHLTVVGQEFQHIADNLVGVVAVEHPRPEIDFPSQTPSRGHVAPLLQRVGCGGKEFRMRIG